MKKFYTTPELEVIKLLTEDVLAASNEGDENDAFIKGDSLFK